MRVWLIASFVCGCINCGDRLPQANASEQRPAVFPNESPPAVSEGRTRLPLAAELEWLGTPVLFEENDDVLLVEPTFVLDPRGGFLVGDRKEAQARRYSASGELLWYFGRRGGGPGEFSSVTAVRRLPSGNIIIADFGGRITLIDSAGHDVRKTFTLPNAIEQLEVLTDTLVLISTRHGGSPRNDPVLHVVDIRSERIVRSFFRPYRKATNPYAAAAAGWTRFALQHDTVAAIFAVIDSVFLFRTDGTFLRSVAIPSASLRRVEADHVPDRSRGRTGIVEWYRQFDLVADVHWMGDGSLLVPYQEVIADSAMSRRWHLVQMASDGRAVAEVRNVPPVETTNEGIIWLQPAGTLLPNTLTRARIRP